MHSMSKESPVKSFDVITREPPDSSEVPLIYPERLKESELHIHDLESGERLDSSVGKEYNCRDGSTSRKCRKA